MKVAIDGQHSVGTATGIGEYAARLAEALRDAGVDVAELSEPRLDPWRFDRRVLWDQVLLPAYARAARADVLHCTAGTVPAAVRMPCVATVHDVAWLRVQAHTRAYARAYFGRISMRLYSRVDRIVVSSRFSRDELLALSTIEPGLVDVVYPIVSSQYGDLIRRPDPRPFILAVGTVEPRKNLAVVIRALAAIEGVRLVVAGPCTPYQAECAALARKLGVDGRVEFRGYIPRAELVDLYARTSLAVAPSTYEGFGYAAAQALCAGVPLIAADASSLPEVVADPTLLMPPGDHEAWSRRIEVLLNDPAAAETAAASRRGAAVRRFAPATAARATIAVYRDALAGYDLRRG